MSEAPCSHDCGYYSSGDDLNDHERYEHDTCRFCGAEPHAWEYSVTHKAGCVRLVTATYAEALATAEKKDPPLSSSGGAP